MITKTSVQGEEFFWIKRNSETRTTTGKNFNTFSCIEDKTFYGLHSELDNNALTIMGLAEVKCIFFPCRQCKEIYLLDPLGDKKMYIDGLS